MYEELQQTGKVDETLPEDDRAIRELHAKEVLGRSESKASPREAVAAVTKSQAKRESSPKRTFDSRQRAERSQTPTVATRKQPTESRPARKLRFHLELSDDVVDAEFEEVNDEKK